MGIFLPVIARKNSATLLLDLYPAAAGYSVARKLRNAYSGSCIRVRRSSDNAEQDIGFDGLDMDTTSLAAFCSGTNGFITTIYDQQSTNNITQTTAARQPKIYDSATGVVTEGGIPCPEYAATHCMVTPFDTRTMDLPYSFFMPVRMVTDSVNGFGNLTFYLGGEGNTALGKFNLLGIANDNDNMSLYRTSGAAYSINSGTYSNALFLHTAIYGSSNVIGYINGSAGTTTAITEGDYGDEELWISSYYTATCNGVLRNPELIIYNTDQSANRVTIESNINSYYSIY